MKDEKTSNFRIDVSELGSGWAAVLMVDVTDKHGTYTDVQQTGIGRYKTRDAAVKEAKSWAAADDYPLEEGVE